MTRVAMLRAAAVAVGLSAALSLSGCGAIKDAVSNKVDDAVAQATDDAKDAVEDALVTGEGEVDLGIDGSVDLPDDFPEGLPLPEGSLTAAFSNSGGWSLAYSVPDEAAIEDFIADLKADGSLTVTNEGEGDGMYVVNLESDQYTIEVLAEAVVGGESTIVYGVYPRNS